MLVFGKLCFDIFISLSASFPPLYCLIFILFNECTRVFLTFLDN